MNNLEWKWTPRIYQGLGLAWVNHRRDQVTFYPYTGFGTAVIRGDTALLRDVHYY